MNFFVDRESVVRKIWSKGDTILFIFAGAAAEFALNKAVDWLYFTGKLPADPLGRLFSTVAYARQIVFSNEEDAFKAIDKITSIHHVVEEKRNASIPDWAYRDVLYMLIHYSIASYELLESELSPFEKQEVYDVFYRMGSRMRLNNLPVNYKQWCIDRENHMQNDLMYSDLTGDLFLQYKKHLGRIRYYILIQAQKLVIPHYVRRQLHFNNIMLIKPLLLLYKYGRKIGLDKVIKSVLLPPKYKKQIADLDEPFQDNRKY